MAAAVRVRPSAQVWDYIGDGYVHRLIQSQLDGKLVELPSPDPGTLRGNSARNSARRTSEHATASGRCKGEAHAGGAAGPAAGAARDSDDDADRAAHDDYNMMQARFAAA